MKVTQQRLKQIIMEEIYNVQETEHEPAQQDSKQKATVSALRNELKDFAMNPSNFKGLDPAEVEGLKNIFSLIFTAAREKSMGSLLRRLGDVISTKIK